MEVNQIFDENGKRDWQAEHEERSKKMAEDMSNFINSMSFSPKEFNKAMSHQHRTLQQSFTRLCAAWLDHCASDEYQTDGRNEGSKDFAKKVIRLVEAEDGYNLPLQNYLGHV